MIAAVLDNFIENMGETSLMNVFHSISSQTSSFCYEDDEYIIMRCKNGKFESTKVGGADQ